MSSLFRQTLVAAVLALLLAGLGSPQSELRGASQESAGESPAGPVDFNEDVRPILSDKCFTCHGPDEAARKTNLRFDTREGMFVELANGGRAIVPGKPGESEVYKRISSEDPVKRMPPGYLGHEKLKDGQIETIRRWIEEGANFELHWAFRKPVRPELPEVENEQWARNAIDYFILDRLKKEGLEPSPEAARRKLVRRVTLDLTGLPPTPREVERFLNDSSPGAYERLVDRLLASPAYAERMAYRWLDAARYADTNGYQNDQERSMWRWRDWVIEAFQNNMPFDQFTVEQLAGDLLPNASRSQIIATGFNRNHRGNGELGIVPEEYHVEYVVDRVETTSTVWMGLTMGCARCHDHKYDPISQKDFYEFYAYFNNVPDRGRYFKYGNTPPKVKAPAREQESRLERFDERLRKLRERLASLEPAIKQAQLVWEEYLTAAGGAFEWGLTRGQAVHAALDGGEAEFRHGDPKFAEGVINKAAAFDGKRYVDLGDRADFGFYDRFTLSAWIYPEAATGGIVTRMDPQASARGSKGYGLYLIGGKLQFRIESADIDDRVRVETAEPLELNRWHHVAVTYDGSRLARGAGLYVNGKRWKPHVIIDHSNNETKADVPLRIGHGPGAEDRFRGRIDEVRIYERALPEAELAVAATPETLNELAQIEPVRRTPVQRKKLRLAFLERFAPAPFSSVWEDIRRLERARKDYYESIPTVMVMAEMDPPRPAHLLKRGAYDQPGERVNPEIPDVLGELPEEYPNNRLGLARWLVSRGHPLTARVTVNRFWQMLWGAGLVRTPENFGFQGETPTHPKLLDWLAVEFMESGWDVKRLMKTIVMSAAYRQSSRALPELLEKDPENWLMARGPRVRLPAEAIRDQALAMAGLLERQVGGPPVKPYQPAGLWEVLSNEDPYEHDEGAGLYRRSLYTFWKRTLGPPFLLTFDAAHRETCIVRTRRTNTPLQALNLMNGVTFLEAARKMAERMMQEGGESRRERIAYGFELATARPPKPGEYETLSKAYGRFLRSFQGDPREAKRYLSEGESPRDKSLDPVKLAAYANVASLILNLDETITKE